MKILFVGDLNEYGRSYQRCRALSAMGHDVLGLSSVPVPFRPGVEGAASLLARARWKLGRPPDPTGANAAIRKAVGENEFDVIWIEKGVTIRPETLAYVKRRSAATLLSLSEDDMFARHNRTRYYDRGLQYYDAVFTTKTYNIAELKTLGAKRTELFSDAYDASLHRPLRLTAEEREEFGAEAGFVGTFEEERAKDMAYLALNGIPVTVWGNGWEGWAGRHPNLVVKQKPVYGEDYAKALNATKVNLCFLRKINRDVATSRSVEIPASGGFMLAERTARHEELFLEGKEAEFFGTREELLEKARYYLAHPGERERIARAGRERCERSGYDHASELGRILARL